MTDALLILNAGSSSLKFCVFRTDDPPELLLRGQIENLLTEPHFVARDATGRVIDEQTWGAGSSLGHEGTIAFLLDQGLRRLQGEVRFAAAGHRVVHGGRDFTQPVLVDDQVLAQLDLLVPLAPLHQAHNIAPMRALKQHAPNLPQVACFDTSFHRTALPVARKFALPRELTDAGIERYGFHGLSYEYIAAKLRQVDPRAASGNTIVAHLGNGASLCAMSASTAVATTMGLTPLDGLVMGTRCGAIDPGVLLYLMDRRGMDARSLEKLLYFQSGLLGVSGLSSDMRELLDHEATNPSAADAIELFVYRTCCEVGALTAALGGLDALVFTGGIGEHSAEIRERVCLGLNWLGLELDSAGNKRGGPCISLRTSTVAAWVIPTNEELMIAQHVQRLLKLK
jgi:acetate kinase